MPLGSPFNFSIPKKTIQWCEATLNPRKDRLCIEIKGSCSPKSKENIERDLKRVLQRHGYRVQKVPLL